jgi:hypothetical protein
MIKIVDVKLIINILIVSLALKTTFGFSQHEKITSTLNSPRLNPIDRIDQSEIENGSLTLHQIRKAGMILFTTPFNKFDGYGDGPQDLTNPDNRSPGNRPTLQANNTFLRVNGLDSQTCLECHTIISNATVPARLGVGGVGGVSQNAIVKPSFIDVGDIKNDGIADFDGRFINPPFLFGSGGVELVGLEMTRELQELKNLAIENPNSVIELNSKGVNFGTIIADSKGNIDTSKIEGVSADLVIKPFGRKGDFATVREFDVDAMSFHLGMQATELVGVDLDKDGDGVVNELKQGDLSALSIFNTTMNRPLESTRDEEEANGFELFNNIGCADCHIPQLNTQSVELPYKLIGSNHLPFEDSFYSFNLTHPPASFETNENGGIMVNLFSDLKQHFMGEDLKETFSLATDKQNGEYITARLWGIADTAPYLHDGRALTLEHAIILHDNPGSEASIQARRFSLLSLEERTQIIKFLNTLRTPPRPNLDVLPRIEINLPN